MIKILSLLATRLLVPKMPVGAMVSVGVLVHFCFCIWCIFTMLTISLFRYNLKTKNPETLRPNQSIDGKNCSQNLFNLLRVLCECKYTPKYNMDQFARPVLVQSTHTWVEQSTSCFIRLTIWTSNVTLPTYILTIFLLCF